MENVRRKHIDIKLVTTDKRRIKLVSEPNYHTTKWFSGNLLAIEIKKIKVNMHKPVYLGLPILETSKTLMINFGMIILNQNMTKKQNYVIWTQIALLFILKLKIFIKILLMMFKVCLIYQIMKSIDHYLKEKIKKW